MGVVRTVVMIPIPVRISGPFHVPADDLPAEIHKDLIHIRSAPCARLVVWFVPPRL